MSKSTKSGSFVVGGVPRGGTTVHARLFNFHEEVSCYFFEAHIFPTIERIAGSFPVQPESFGAVENFYRSVLLGSLIDLPYQSRLLTKEDYQMGYSFSALEIEDLVMNFMALIRNGSFGKEILSESRQFFFDLLRQKSGKSVVGEKSPTNAGVFARHGLCGLDHVFLVVREPFSTIKSMKARAENANDKYNSAFIGSLWQQCGLWISEAETVLGALQHEGMSLWRYEDLLKSPIETAGSMFQKVGLELGSTAVMDIQKLIGTPKQPPIWQTMATNDFKLIEAITASARKRLGYEDVTTPGTEFVSDDVSMQEEDVLVISGAHPKNESEPHLWLQSSGMILVRSRLHRRSLSFKMWLNSPAFSKIHGSVADFTFADYASDGKQLAQHQVAVGEVSFFSVNVQLADVQPVFADTSSEFRLISFKAGHSYAPFLTPAAKHTRRRDDAVSGNLIGLDVRDLSCMLIETSLS
jgi:hypothetical protein